MEKYKIKLRAEKETLFIPLFSKAAESKKSHKILYDPKAENILQKIDYNFENLKIPRQTLITLAIRSKKFDSYVKDYLRRSNYPLVLHLGCGLDSRFLRVGFNRGAWYDIDYPDVINLRRQFYGESDDYHMIDSSVTAQGWLDQIPVANNPAYIVAEGLLMYLHENEVKQLLLNLQSRFPGSEVAFDAYSCLAAKGVNRHPSVKKTGAYIHWGIDDAQLIHEWSSGLEVIDEWYFTDSEDIPFFGFKDRILFKIMGMFNIAKKAHRIFRVRL